MGSYNNLYLSESPGHNFYIHYVINHGDCTLLRVDQHVKMRFARETFYKREKSGPYICSSKSQVKQQLNVILTKTLNEPPLNTLLKA